MTLKELYQKLTLSDLEKIVELSNCINYMGRKGVPFPPYGILQIVHNPISRQEIEAIVSRAHRELYGKLESFQFLRLYYDLDNPSFSKEETKLLITEYHLARKDYQNCYLTECPEGTAWTSYVCRFVKSFVNQGYGLEQFISISRNKLYMGFVVPWEITQDLKCFKEYRKVEFGTQTADNPGLAQFVFGDARAVTFDRRKKEYRVIPYFILYQYASMIGITPEESLDKYVVIFRNTYGFIPKYIGNEENTRIQLANKGRFVDYNAPT